MHIHTSDQEKLSLGIGKYSCNWGTHICGLYETEKERDEIIFGYLEAGFLANDRNLFIHSEKSPDEFYRKFGLFCPGCAAHVNNSELFDIKQAKDLYYPEGTFDPWHMNNVVNGYYTYTQEMGPTNVRAIADMLWAKESIPGVEYLFAYESRLNYFVAGKTLVSICLYNVTKFTGDIIIKVLQTHPFTLNGGIITQNPYYIHPDKWLAEHAPQFLD